jgi:hypothetical protein
VSPGSAMSSSDCPAKIRPVCPRKQPAGIARACKAIRAASRSFRSSLSARGESDQNELAHCILPVIVFARSYVARRLRKLTAAAWPSAARSASGEEAARVLSRAQPLQNLPPPGDPWRERIAAVVDSAFEEVGEDGDVLVGEV